MPHNLPVHREEFTNHEYKKSSKGCMPRPELSMQLVPLLGTIFLGGLLVISLAAGCAQLAWVKPNADARMMTSDLEDCRRDARLQAFQFGALRNSPMPNVVIDPTRPATAVQIPSTLPARDAVTEQEVTMMCMRQKGYELVRVR